MVTRERHVKNRSVSENGSVYDVSEEAPEIVRANVGQGAAEVLAGCCRRGACSGLHTAAAAPLRGQPRPGVRFYRDDTADHGNIPCT